ncbi:MAG TPA: arginine deiminase family protein [Pyrinomonadaceae bacterium]
MSLFKRAIVRPPGTNFSDGLTTVDLGQPDVSKALAQHQRYCEVLESCGLALTTLPADDRYPDSTFVEDTAILTDRCAVVTLPGADSRRGEIAAINDLLPQFFEEIHLIQEPGRVDGGDICEAGEHFFIGISKRTNEDGAHQLAEILSSYGFTSEFVDIRNIKSILHLKSGVAYLNSKQLVVIDELADRFKGYEVIRVDAGDEYAANCVEINNSVLVAAGYPSFALRLQKDGHQVVEVEMSEFQKMDGGLSCLSLRF